MGDRGLPHGETTGSFTGPRDETASSTVSVIALAPTQLSVEQARLERRATQADERAAACALEQALLDEPGFVDALCALRARSSAAQSRAQRLGL